MHGMLALVQLRRTSDEIYRARLSDVRFEDTVRIVKVTQDKIEAGKIRSEISRRLDVFREKFRERRHFDGTHLVGIETLLCQSCDLSATENFEVRVWKTIAQQFYRGQRQDEIADGAAADDQNALQVSNA
jgi:hypothetical protein